MNIVEIRRHNLRKLMDTQSASAISKQLGYQHPSYLSQLAGPNPTRDISEKTARRFEKELNLSEGYLDQDPDVLTTPAATHITNLVADVIRMVGAVCASEKIELGTPRMADIAALAFSDAMEHGGKGREAYVRQVVRLLK